MVRQKVHEIIGWVRSNWRRLLIWGGGGLLGIFLLIQLFYPSNLLLPFTTVDNQSFSMQDKDTAKKALADKYKKHSIELYFGNAKQAYRSPSPAEIGLVIDNQERIDRLDYPVWLRLVPTSILWGSVVNPVKEPIYRHTTKTLDEYMEKELGQSCNVAPKNASLKVEGGNIKTVAAEKGGTCRLDDVKHQLESVKPRINKASKVTVAMKERSPVIDDSKATELKSQLEARVKSGVRMVAGSEVVTVPREQLVSWLDFASNDNGIKVQVNAERSSKYFGEQVAPKVTRAAGVSKVSTMDFMETSRIDGVPGQALDTTGTLDSLSLYLTSGGDMPKAAIKSVAPRIEYTRSYSPTDVGLAALLKQYAESHPGSYGISLVELSGQRRHAAHQDTKQFRTASTYKLYVAYGALKRVEAGAWKWSDQVHGGRTLEKCLDDMIVKSDNPCGEVLLQRIGYTALTNELKAVGLTGTSFTGSEPVTTAGDLAVFNASLESGQLMSPASRERLLGAMKRNVYRQGIPAGTNGTVANKVGFLDAYLHDAAVIYGPNGPAVLCVMTSGSSWATIADLTKQIEALRAR